MICWYCYWGWPKPVADIYDAHGGEALNCGPGHVVWGDENFDDSSIDFCMGEAAKEGDENCRRSLVALRALPLSVRVPRQDYQDLETEATPEIYPPPPDLPMVKR